jgi:succinate dehydrogenase/fumarate reductase-like Fe-S protein
MNQEITALVFRFDPDQDKEPRFDEYRLRAEEEVSVLVLLNRIQQEIDHTLSFRSYCCGLQMCGSCLMKINQKKRFACITLVRPGERVAIEPASYPEGHIKDLVVKMEDQK